MLAIDELRSRFAQSEGLPFSDVLTEANILAVLESLEIGFRDRVFNPVTTLWGFLSQVLSEDHSYQDAVARIVAHRSAQGREICSPNTAAYCKARQRLSLELITILARNAASSLETQVSTEWQWLGRTVKIIDGSSVSMPDTPENQAVYPQPDSQEPGIGFPLARIAALFSLSTGACLDFGIAPWRGKGTSERSLFRQMIDRLEQGDVILADKFYDDYITTAILRERGVDVVIRLGDTRNKLEHKRLGPGDRIVVWFRPARPEWLDKATYDRLPRKMLIRETSFDASASNNRTEFVTVGTTLLDPAEVPQPEFGNLYRQRWNCELDLRSLKTVMRMDILRCKTPEMVVKEIWVHLLAYNLLRTAIAAAAKENNAKPREVSFKGAKQAITAFAPKFESAPPEFRARLVADLLQIVAYHRVGDRPGRIEPRAVKRRRKPMRLLTMPRNLAKQEIAKWA
jgi:hypothetical protein